ncbi:MAG: amidohydrolase family protein [Chloroflexi bacterium]|nr:amidohydrolase family protein [Chloroflexota bacterium]
MRQREVQRVDTVVHGGTVVTSTETHEGAVAIQGEKVVAVGPRELLPPADRYIDATGKYVLPGAIDVHIHLGTPEEGRADDWRSGTIAAAHAGVTSIVSFAGADISKKETPPQAVIRFKEHVSKQSVVDFSFHANLANESYIFEGLERFIPEAIRLGAPSFKMFMQYGGRVSDKFLAKAMEVIAANGGLAQVHCENGDACEYLEEKALAEERVRPLDWPSTRPPWTEEEAVRRAIYFAEITKCPLHVVHLSSHGALEEIKEAQRRGVKVWTETCPQYMLLSEKDMERLGPFIKISPPVRPADMIHQNAMWRGLEHGYISVVASDHAPKHKEDQEHGWQNIFMNPQGGRVPLGSPNVQTMVPLAYSEGVVKRGLPITWIARALAENPARIFGLYPRKGAIRPGSDADLLIIDPEPEYIVRAVDLQGNSKYNPYEGWKLKGRPWMTLLRGKVLLSQGKLEQRAGYGQFLQAGSPHPPIAGRGN